MNSLFRNVLSYYLLYWIKKPDYPHQREKRAEKCRISSRCTKNVKRMGMMKTRKLLKCTATCFTVLMVTLAINAISPVVASNGSFKGSQAENENAQAVPEMMWNKTYGGTGKDYAYSLVQTADGGFALAGYTTSYGAGDNDPWLVKIAADGTAEWNKTYGGIEDDKANSLVLTADGGFALAGDTYSYGAGYYDFWFVKTAADGTAEWNKTYGGTDSERGCSLVQTTDGGFALVGTIGNYGEGTADFWFVKTAADGTAEWNKTYGGTGSDIAYSLVQTADGGFALAGDTYSYGAGNGDVWLVKTAADGTTEWNKTYGGIEGDTAYSLVQTADGGFALAGSTGPAGTDMKDFWLVKTAADGTEQWNKTYGETGDDRATSLVQTADGGFALAGITSSYGAGGADFWLVKTAADGTAEWNKTYGGTGSDRAWSLVQTADGGFALAGYTYSYGAGTADFWLVKTATIIATTTTTYTTTTTTTKFSSTNVAGLEILPLLLAVITLAFWNRWKKRPVSHQKKG